MVAAAGDTQLLGDGCSLLLLEPAVDLTMLQAGRPPINQRTQSM